MRKSIGRWAAFLGAMVLVYCTAYGAVEDLDRGHRILLNRGLQLQALVLDYNAFDLDRWAESRFTTANFWARALPQFLGPPPGIPWGRWTDGGGGEGAGDFLRPEELPFEKSFVSLQVGDEQDLVGEVLEETAAVMARQKARYTNTLIYTDQFGTQMSVEDLRRYMETAQPDMMVLNSYEFKGEVPGGSPTKLYSNLQKYRLLALAGNDGTGTRPIPAGVYIQTFYGQGDWDRPVSESEVRLNQFAVWAFGYKMSIAFIYDVDPPSYGAFIPMLFEEGGDSSPTPFFYRVAEMNRQSLNLGPSLLRLVSTDIRLVRGRHRVLGLFDVRNARPDGVEDWDADAVPHIVGISARNDNPLVNSGLPGDVVVGVFRVLDESFDGEEWTGETYFMIVNGLSDANHPASETRQTIRIDFDFSGTPIERLQRRSRETGEIEVVPLISDGGSLRHLDLTLDGGTGDLFKFDTGAPFVGPSREYDGMEIR